MLAYIPVIFLAATAAALPESAPGILTRSALHSMLVRGVTQRCDPNQRLICCNKPESCAELDMDDLSNPDFLYEHCTGTVACCDLGDTKITNSTNWGNIKQSCNSIDILSTVHASPVPLSPASSKPVGSNAPSSIHIVPFKQNGTVTATEVISGYTTYCPLPATTDIGSIIYTAHKKPQPTKEAEAHNAPQAPAVESTSVATAGAESRSVAYGFAIAVAGVACAFAL